MAAATLRRHRLFVGGVDADGELHCRYQVAAPTAKPVTDSHHLAKRSESRKPTVPTMNRRPVVNSVGWLAQTAEETASHQRTDEAAEHH